MTIVTLLPAIGSADKQVHSPHRGGPSVKKKQTGGLWPKGADDGDLTFRKDRGIRDLVLPCLKEARGRGVKTIEGATNMRSDGNPFGHFSFG